MRNEVYSERDDEGVTRYYQTNNPKKSLWKGLVESIEVLGAGIAAGVAAYGTSKLGVPVEEEVVFGVGTLLFKFASKTVRDMLKKRPA